MIKLSRHAEIRSQQRALPRHIIETIMNYGNVSYAPGGVYKIYFGNKECAYAVSDLKKKIKEFERAKGGAILLGENKIITVYKQ